MLPDPIREKMIAMFSVALCVAALFAAGIFAGANKQGAVIQVSPDRNWIVFTHESGGKYIVRTSAIVGFNAPSDVSGLRNIILVGNHTVHTSMSIDEFSRIIKEEGGLVEAVDD